MDTTLAQQDSPTRILDIRGARLGEQTDGRAAENAAILKRILQNKGIEVPVAAFQSSI